MRSQAISSALLLLAMNPIIQERLLADLQNIFFTDDDEIDDHLLNQLTYLEMVIKEALRLFPATLITARKVENDVELSNQVRKYQLRLTNFKISLANYTVPGGTYLAFMVQKVHTDEKYWGEDALKFNPERFSSDNIHNVHPYAYLPFSKGFRICPGNRYAMMTVKVFLSKFLLKYRVSTDLTYEGLRFCFSSTTVVKQGYMMTVERRK